MKRLFYTLLCSLLFNISTAHSASLTKIIEDTPNETLTTAQPVLLNDYLLFQTSQNGQDTLWSQNTETNERIAIYQGPIDFGANNNNTFLKIDQLVYFLTISNNNKHLWRTDGTTAGTQQLANTLIFQDLVNAQDFAVSQSVDGDLVVSDGQDTIVHDFNFASTGNVCVFDLNNIITKDSDGQNDQLKQSVNGQVETIDLSFENPMLFINKQNMWVKGDTCFIGIFDQGQSSDVIMIDKDGHVTKLSESLDISGMINIFTFSDYVYAIIQSEDSIKVVRLSAELQEFEISKPVVDGDQFNLEYYALLSDFIVISLYSPLATPQLSFNYYLDSELVLNESLTFQPTPDEYFTSDGAIYTQKVYQNGVYKSHLANHISMSPISLIIQDELQTLATDQSSKQVYLSLKDKQTGQQSIALLTETPGIGQSINGLWYDPEILSQGISIHTGERNDGSQYIFVTVYTFLDGNQLWLAGVADIEQPQTDITVTLYNSSDGELFQSGITPIENTFGTMKIEMTGCDQLRATLQSENPEIVLNLSRIDNVQFNHLCYE